MSVAPEPYHTACLEVLHHAAIKARMIAFEDDFEREQLRDLMDAVHNIPRWLRLAELRPRRAKVFAGSLRRAVGIQGMAEIEHNLRRSD
jgi:hypothetical protein